MKAPAVALARFAEKILFKYFDFLWRIKVFLAAAKMKNCSTLSSENYCMWYVHCKWDGDACDFLDQNDKPVAPKGVECPPPWYLWQILLTVFVCQLVFIILIVTCTECVQELYVKLKGVGNDLKDKVKSGCEDFAQMLATYNRRALRQGGYRRLERQPVNPSRVIFNRPEHVTVEMEPLIHRPMRSAPRKEHLE